MWSDGIFTPPHIQYVHCTQDVTQSTGLRKRYLLTWTDHCCVCLVRRHVLLAAGFITVPPTCSSHFLLSFVRFPYICKSLHVTINAHFSFLLLNWKASLCLWYRNKKVSWDPRWDTKYHHRSKNPLKMYLLGLCSGPTIPPAQSHKKRKLSG